MTRASLPAIVLFILWLLLASVAVAQDKSAIDRDAIEKRVALGVEFLRHAQSKDGTWVFQKESPEFNCGATALVGIALLESGVDKNDPALQTIARIVRASGPKLTKTYAIALAVMFLDRHEAGPRDVDLIRQLAFRLAGAQDRKTGGWSYDCRSLNATEQSQLLSFLQKNRGPFKFPQQRPDTSHVRGIGADNSNTQFAILALWIARRRNIPVDYPLRLAEWRFRVTQLKDGGWGYGRDGSIDQAGATGMTCTGLLALALAYGLEKDRQASLQSGGHLDKAAETKGPSAQLLQAIGDDTAIAAAKAFLAAKISKGEAPGIQHLYFLWSLERVAVVYGFKELNGLDWYAWGSQHLLKTQKRDGSWEVDNGPVVDTCFALLFLKKVNLFPDLSEGINGKGNEGQK
jgi:hypothetical protein